jgi:DNA-directed RNA polymerase subunit RPC12/RpoP
MTEDLPLDELRCMTCGTRYQLRFYRRAGSILRETDTTCPACREKATEVLTRMLVEGAGPEQH